MQNIIQTQRLSKCYAQRFAVRDLNLAVPEGSVYGFIGPNGAGKSTTMKLLLGLLRPTGGKAYLFGRELTPRTRLELLRRTGSLIEQPPGYGHLTGEENLRIVAELKGLEGPAVERALEIVRLTGEKDKKVRAYSLGMRQRLGVAIALLGEPSLLVLDEPTNGLDPAGMQEMRTLIRELPQRTGATVLISSHLLSELEQIVDHVGIIDRGSLLYQGPLAGLKEHSRGEVALRTLDPDAARRTLKSLNLPSREEDGLLILPPMRDEALSLAVAALCENGAGVVGVTERAKTLEALFLSLTGGKSGEGTIACAAS